MAVDMEQVRAAIDGADDEAIVRLFEGVSERDRRAVAGAVRKLQRDLLRVSQESVDTPRNYALETTVGLAVLATSSVSQVPHTVWSFDSPHCLLQILLQRPTAWIETWVRDELERGERCDWIIVLELMRRGCCDPVENDTFILEMVNGLTALGRRNEKTLTEVPDILRANDDLLDRAVWRVFEITDTQARGIGNHDHWTSGKPGTTWKGALVQFAAEGRLSRDRLLTASLEALCRDFNRSEARWFAELFEAMEPTPEELGTRIGYFFEHLRGGNPQVVQFGLKQLDRVEKARRKNKQEPLPVESYTEALPSMLRHTSKTMVRKTFSLMKRLVKLAPDSLPRFAELASGLLTDESPDVQAMTLDFIEQLIPKPDARVRRVLADYHDAVAASLRRRFEAYVSEGEGTPKSTAEARKQPTASKTPSKPVTKKRTQKAVKGTSDPFGIADLCAAAEDELPTLRPIDAETLFALPRCTPDREVSPVASVDELIEICSTWIESPDDPENEDRILDGFCRFRDAIDEPDFEKRCGPLAARVAKRCEAEWGVESVLMSLIHFWARRSMPEMPNYLRTYVDGSEWEERPIHELQAPELLQRLCLDVRTCLGDRTSFTVLSSATHRGGWLDPRVFVDRWILARNEGTRVFSTDVLRALLRLPSDGRQEALERLNKAAQGKPSQFESAIRYALGDDAVEIGTDVALWAAAARARAPRADDHRLAEARPSQTQDYALRRECRFTAYVDEYNSAGVRIRGIDDRKQERVEYDVRLGDYFAWPQRISSAHRMGETLGSTLHFWPSGWNTYCLVAATTLIENVDWWEARWDNRGLLEPLLEPDYPLTLPAALLLSVGLGCKEPGEHGLATDIAIAAIDDGRLTAENLGPALKIVFGSKNIAPSRWAKTLRDVAGISALHAYVVFESMVASLPTAKDELPKNPASYFELMNELSAELGLGIRDDAVRKMFEEFKGSSKAAKLAKSLLAAETALAEGARAEIIERAIEGRMARIRVKE